MNSATTHWVTGANGSIERGSVEKPPERHGREGMADRLERVHPVVQAREADHEQDPEEDERQRDVEQPEPSRGVADPLGELVHLGPGKLGLEHLPSADPESGEHREREDDDPHPAEPLAELAPEEEPSGRAPRRRRPPSRPWSRSRTSPRRRRPRDARPGASPEKRYGRDGVRRRRAATSARRRGSPRGSRSGRATAGRAA